MRIPRPNIHIPRPHISAHTVAFIIKAFAFAGALLLIFLVIRINANTNMLAKQAKATADQNQRIARANGRHIDCLANLFAQYTRNEKPIEKADLDKCQITEEEAAGIIGSSLLTGAVDFTAPSTTAPATNQKTPSTNSTTNLPTSSNQNPTPTNPTPTTPSPEPVRVLGVPACVPDPLGLINGGVCVTKGSQ